MKILAKNFKFRADLENHVRNKFGLTPDIKDHTIEGTKEELALLQLGDRNVFWGIKCVVTDKPTEVRETTKPNRGQLKDFGINKRTKKPRK